MYVYIYVYTNKQWTINAYIDTAATKLVSESMWITLKAH